MYAAYLFPFGPRKGNNTSSPTKKRINHLDEPRIHRKIIVFELTGFSFSNTFNKYLDLLDLMYYYRISITGYDTMEYRDLYSGLIRLHILYHAEERPIFGLEIIEELGRHGYKLSPGTIYPILHGMKEKGYLRSETEVVSGHVRRIYKVTPKGKEALEKAKSKVQELFGELFEIK
jgi:PadR family transcriptional regulator PadR